LVRMNSNFKVVLVFTDQHTVTKLFKKITHFPYLVICSSQYTQYILFIYFAKLKGDIIVVS